MPMTVVETEEFLQKTNRSCRTRNVRWGLAGRGKRGGARVIYYYHSERLPLFLLTAYPKNEKENLSKAECNAMKRLVPILVAGYPAKK